MINVKIRESKENKPSESFVRVEGLLTHDIVESTIRSILWSFESDDSTLLHSGDATQDVFLNYNNPSQPLIEIKLPVQGVYPVRLVAKVLVEVEKNVEVSSLDDNNIVVKSQELRTVIDEYISKSNLINIAWDDAEGGWV